MSILVDRPVWHLRGERWSHLISDTSLDELHDFAAALGLPRRAFHRDHYDIPERLLDAAIDAGARLVDPRVIVRSLRAAGLRRRPACVAPEGRDAAAPGSGGTAPTDMRH